MTWYDNKSVDMSLKILRNQAHLGFVRNVPNSVRIPVVDTVENHVLRTTVEAMNPVHDALQERLNADLV